jgi:hypothetical protein
MPQTITVQATNGKSVRLSTQPLSSDIFAGSQLTDYTKGVATFTNGITVKATVLSYDDLPQLTSYVHMLLDDLSNDPYDGELMLKVLEAKTALYSSYHEMIDHISRADKCNSVASYDRKQWQLTYQFTSRLMDYEYLMSQNGMTVVTETDDDGLVEVHYEHPKTLQYMPSIHNMIRDSALW